MLYLILSVLTIVVSFGRSFVWSLNYVDWKSKKDLICQPEGHAHLLNSTPIEVSVLLRIFDIYEIDETKMQFGLQMSKVALWKNPTSALKDVNISHPITIPQFIVDCMWKPDHTFYICKYLHLYRDGNENLQIAYTMLKDNLILYHATYNMIVSCSMEFSFYPMDTQSCVLFLALIKTSDDIATMKWMKDSSEPLARSYKSSIVVLNHVKGQKFWMEKPKLGYSLRSYITGNFTYLSCKFVFVRYVTASLINTYVPSFLVVSLSFISFWLDIQAVPGRVTLGVTALLTLATQMHSARATLPAVNYMTALDIWLFGCLFFVFLSLLEFVIANSAVRKQQNQTYKTKPVEITSMSKEVRDKAAVKPTRVAFSPSDTNPVECSSLVSTKMRGKIPYKLMKLKVKNFNLVPCFENYDIDSYAKLFFPAAFLVFSVCYWGYYMIRAKKVI